MQEESKAQPGKDIKQGSTSHRVLVPNIYLALQQLFSSQNPCWPSLQQKHPPPGWLQCLTLKNKGSDRDNKECIK